MCAGFRLTVLGTANIEITCLHTMRKPVSTSIFSVEALCQVNNQTDDEFVYFGGNINHNVDLHLGHLAPTQSMVQLPEAHPQTVQPTERSPRAQNPDVKSGDNRETMLYGCVIESVALCSIIVLWYVADTFNMLIPYQ